VLGALFFGWLTDRLGRKKLFFITLVVYLVATGATALSWNFWSFALFRFLTGAGSAANMPRSTRPSRS
jgi:MFS family permease